MGSINVMHAVQTPRHPPAAAPIEEALTFICGTETLVGIVHRPAVHASTDAATTGLIVIVGGPQYRVGSHRQFVHLARALAGAGHPVLRFDVTGMGDSTGELRGFEQIGDEIAAAIDLLQRCQPSVQRVVLWGLCDGASAALLYLHQTSDARVRGLCLLNPWVRSPVSLARTQVKHYYRDRLLQKDFWTKLATGRIGVTALSGLVDSLRRMHGRHDRHDDPPRSSSEVLSFQQRMADAWRGFAHPVLLMLSERDYTAKEFIEHVTSHPAWSGALHRRGLCRFDLPAADHTCSTAAARAEVEARTLQWLAGVSA
jgi:exosortase A-associated hydrolase 1